MEIKQAEFSLSAPMVSMCPKDTKPEYAFIGRSNVGKSSLINMLTNNKKLAKTSSTPGKTLLINHFIINKEWYLVDLPGYGYAKRSKKEVDKLDQMIRGYILQREQLVNVFVLVDIRLEPQKIDLDCHHLHQGRQADAQQVSSGNGCLWQETVRNLGRVAAHVPYLCREEGRSRRCPQLH